MNRWSYIALDFLIVVASYKNVQSNFAGLEIHRQLGISRSPKLMRSFKSFTLHDVNDMKSFESLLTRGGYSNNTVTNAQTKGSSEVSSIALVCGTTVGAGILALPRLQISTLYFHVGG